MSKGKRNFDACQLNKVHIQDYVLEHPAELDALSFRYVRRSDSDHGSGLMIRAEDADPQTCGPYAGSQAILHCPKTEQDGIEITSAATNHNGRDRAYNSLRSKAAAIACAKCVFAGMDPIEAAQYTSQLAAAERDRLEQLTARALALEELAAVDPAFGNI